MKSAVLDVIFVWRFPFVRTEQPDHSIIMRISLLIKTIQPEHSKTLGPAGRGSDFWKTSLVSVKILAAAAFCVHSFQNIAPRASEMK